MGDEAWEELVNKDGTKEKVYNFGDITNRLKESGEINYGYGRKMFAHQLSAAEIKGLRAYFGNNYTEEE